MQRFYWLERGTLAGCSRPGAHGQGENRQTQRRHGPDETVEALESDLLWLRQQGVGAVLSLTETPLEVEVLTAQGLEVLHLPIPDLTAPLPAEFRRALDFIDWQRSSGRAVAVHCLMGQGRTGAILAAYLIRGGASAEAAIADVRAICPGAIGSEEQAAALHAFAERRDWIL